MPGSEDAPPIREFADRGIIWLLSSPQSLREFMEIAGKEIAEKLDFSRAERINRSLIPDTLHKQEADLLYRIPFQDGTGGVFVYLLLEHQSEPDTAMPLRLLSYMVEVWRSERRQWEEHRIPESDRLLTPIVPVVFYTGERNWNTAIRLDRMMRVPEMIKAYVPVFNTLFLSLQGLTKNQLSASSTGWILQALQASEAPHEILAPLLEQAVLFLESLPEEAQAEWSRAIHYLALLIRHKRPGLERPMLYEHLSKHTSSGRAKELDEMIRTDAEELREEGREEGRQEGRLEGRLEMLLAQLEFKFGDLPEATIEKLRELSEANLHEIGRRLLNANTLEELGL